MKRTVAEFHQTTNKIPPPRNHGTLNLFPVLEPEVGEQTEEQKKHQRIMLKIIMSDFLQDQILI